MGIDFYLKFEVIWNVLTGIGEGIAKQYYKLHKPKNFLQRGCCWCPFFRSAPDNGYQFVLLCAKLFPSYVLPLLLPESFFAVHYTVSTCATMFGYRLGLLVLNRDSGFVQISNANLTTYKIITSSKVMSVLLLSTSLTSVVSNISVPILRRQNTAYRRWSEIKNWLCNVKIRVQYLCAAIILRPVFNVF